MEFILRNYYRNRHGDKVQLQQKHTNRLVWVNTVTRSYYTTNVHGRYGEALVNSRDIVSVWVDDAEEFPLPEWAARKAQPWKIQGMQQLYTRCGRIVGNATIFDITVDVNGKPEFHTITDAGSVAVYTHNELINRYELGDYILKDFPNPKAEEIIASL